MPKYDESKDRVVSKLGHQKGVGEPGVVGLRAAAVRYDNGPIKLSIERVYTSADGSTQHRKQGRLSVSEAKFVAHAARKFVRLAIEKGW